MLPNISAVKIHKDGNVSDHLDLPLTTVRMKRAPLLEKGELNRALNLKGFVVLLTDLLQRAGFAAGQLARPALPTLPIVSLTKQVEEGKVVEPPRILFAEAIVARARFAVRLAHKISRRFLQERNLADIDVVVIYRSNADAQLLQRPRPKPAFLDEALDRDQQWIAGEGGRSRVRRVPGSNRPKRKHLPDRLSRDSEEIHESIGGRTKIADAASRGQRCWMQKNPGSSLKRHGRKKSQLCAGTGSIL